MKISVHLTLEVDPEAWGRMYGQETASEVREDVKTYVLNQVQGSAGVEESGADVTLN